MNSSKGGASICLVMRFFLPLAVLALPMVVLAADQTQVPDCVEVTKEAPYQAYGHTHIVVVRNGCDSRIQCQVATNVDPEPQRVTVAPGETSRTATRRGSPSREFDARVTCTED